jgi:hypothetical protein
VWASESFLGDFATFEMMRRSHLTVSSAVAATFVVADCSDRCLPGAYTHLPVHLFLRCLGCGLRYNPALRVHRYPGLWPNPSLMGSVRWFPGQARFFISFHPPLRSLCWSRPRSELLFRFRLPPPKRRRQPLCSSTRSWFRSLQRARP